MIDIYWLFYVSEYTRSNHSQQKEIYNNKKNVFFSSYKEFSAPYNLDNFIF